MLSNNIKSKIMSNTNKAFKITVGVKPEYLSKNHKTSATTHCSPNSSSSNFYYNSQYSKVGKKNPEKNLKNAIDAISKKKVVNYNIINNIQDNSTQINIYTGNDLIKSLNLYWNSIINSTKSTSPFYDNNLSKKKLGTKTLSKKNKKMKNMKQFIEKHMKEKKAKDSHTERNSSNEKLLKLLLNDLTR